MVGHISEYSGEETEETRVYRPDAKVQLKEEKRIIILEMSVPWMENRESKLKEKIDKYQSVRSNLKLRYPDYEIGQATFIMDVLGGYSKSLKDNIEKLIKDKRTVEKVIFNMQKAVLSDSSTIARKFKMSTR